MTKEQVTQTTCKKYQHPFKTDITAGVLPSSISSPKMTDKNLKNHSLWNERKKNKFYQNKKIDN